MSQTRTHSAAWDTRAIAAAMFVVAWLTVQLLVPTLGLLGRRPSVAGWQMYTAFPPVPAGAWVEHADGRLEPVDFMDLFAVPRAEIDFAAALRTGLCDARPDAVAILIQQSPSDHVERVTCG